MKLNELYEVRKNELTKEAKSGTSGYADWTSPYTPPRSPQPGVASWRTPKKTKINAEQTAPPGTATATATPPGQSTPEQPPKPPKIKPKGLTFNKALTRYGKSGLLGAGIGAGIGYLTSNDENKNKNALIGGVLGGGSLTGLRHFKAGNPFLKQLFRVFRTVKR